MSTGQSGSATGYLTALFREGTLSSKSDSELLEQFIAARSDRDDQAEIAFSVLLQRHGSMVLRVCRLVLGDDHQAEDAYQATFLVLASRARSIRRRVSLASWLFGVALRLAQTERSRAARRKRHERRHAEMISQSRANTPPYDEAARALHEELGLLPERYRSAVVLCYLEGLTHEAAALRLGRPVGTVHSRLATARERLEARIDPARLAPAVIPALTISDGASTVVPAALEEATLRASLQAVLGKTSIAGVASAKAIALMESTMKSMTICRFVAGSAAVLAASFLTFGVGVAAYSSLMLENGPGPVRAAGAAAIVEQRSTQEKAKSPTPAGAAEPQSTVEKSSAKASSASSAPIFIEVETVDAQGKPLSGVRVGVSVYHAPRRPAERTGMVQLSTDEQGKARTSRVEVAPGEQASSATIWGYKPGRALGRVSLAIAEKSPPPVRLALNEPVNRTIRVVGHDGKPIEGVRVAPRVLQLGSGRSSDSIPEAWRDELVRTTDENGAVVITAVSRSMAMLTVELSGGRGIARHTVEVPEAEGKDKYTIKLGEPGRLVGVVRNESGEPMVDVPVNVWVRASGAVPGGVGLPHGRRRATRTEAVQFVFDSPRTGPLGEFRTPAALLGGFSYRVSICHEGFAPFLSAWVELAGERTTVSPVRLRALRNLIGSVQDRQGQAVAGRGFSCLGVGPRRPRMPRGDLSSPASSPGKRLCWFSGRAFVSRVGWRTRR